MLRYVNSSLTISLVLGAAYGKLVGGGTAPLSSYRYSPYPIPSVGLNNQLASLQYTAAPNPGIKTSFSIVSFKS